MIIDYRININYHVYWLQAKRSLGFTMYFLYVQVLISTHLDRSGRAWVLARLLKMPKYQRRNQTKS